MSAPIPTRIASGLREKILNGVLKPGDRLPSTRLYAAELGVSRGSVVSAYEQLAGEGFLLTSSGGTRVHPNLPTVPARVPVKESRPSPRESVLPLTPGAPDTRALTSELWRSSFRRAAAEPRAYPAPGSWRLRSLIAENLRLTRSVAVSADNVLITAGARDGLRSLLAVVDGAVGVVEPGYPSLHRIPHTLGRRVISLPADHDGMSIEGLERHKPEIILVMPNHLYPTGQQMPAARRLELIEWARANNAVLVEDDYDSELRVVQPAMTGIDPAVVLLGSFAKILSPALGVGYMVVNRPVPTAPVSGIIQDALSFYMEGDGLARHTARMRREYARRVEIFHEVFPQGIPMDGGLNAVVEGIEPVEGFGVAELSEYWSSADRQGIVLGLGTHAGQGLRRQLELLKKRGTMSHG